MEYNQNQNQDNKGNHGNGGKEEPPEVTKARMATRLFTIYCAIVDAERKVCDAICEGPQGWGGDGETLAHLMEVSSRLAEIRSAHDRFCKDAIGFSVAEQVARKIDDMLGR